MPHIIVKLYSGRTDDQKTQLAEKIAQNVVEVTGCKERSVSVAFEEFEPEAWTEEVYRPDILEGKGILYKKPGYNPFTEETSEDNSKKAPDLMAFVRGAAEQAAKDDDSGMFNPMSWLDLALEDNPQVFDPCFDTPWSALSDADKADRMMAIRRVL